jgi:hypothetical protein
MSSEKYCLRIQKKVRASTVACLQCAACISDLLAIFMTVGSYRAQSPEHDDLSEVGSVGTNPAPSLAPSQPEKELSLPVKGMYPLLDLITEQGSSGLGKYPFSHRLDQRPEHFSRQDCHCPRSSPRIYQRTFPGCLFFHHKSQFQNAGRPCSQAARYLWFKRRDREVSLGNKSRR